MLAPMRSLLGAVRRRRKPPATSGLSYHRLLGGKRLGVGDVYAPIVPKPCSRKFKERVAMTYAQLAPAAFDSIINGDEIAKFLFGGSGGGGGGGSASGGDSVLRRSETHHHHNSSGLPPNASLRASIAAGIQETLNLIWRPQDPDHPEDEFFAKAGGGGAAGAHTAVPGASNTRHRAQHNNNNNRSTSETESYACDPSRPQPNAPSASQPVPGCTVPRACSSYIPALRNDLRADSRNNNRNNNGQNSTPAPPATLPRAVHIGRTRAAPVAPPVHYPPSQPEDLQFRPLGSGRLNLSGEDLV